MVRVGQELVNGDVQVELELALNEVHLVWRPENSASSRPTITSSFTGSCATRKRLSASPALFVTKIVNAQIKLD